MKRSFFSIVFMMLVGTNFSYTQVYENVYQNAGSEVRSKLNQNKMAGIDILTGVQAHHTIGITGLSANRKTELEVLLTNNDQVTDYAVSGDLKSLTLDTSARFTKDEITDLLESLNLVMSGYTVTYSINE